MSAPETWRVVLEDGSVREARASLYETDDAEAWTPDMPRVVRGAPTARAAVTRIAAEMRWPVVEILAPGQQSRAEAETLRSRASYDEATEAVSAIVENRVRAECNAEIAALRLQLRAVTDALAKAEAQVAAIEARGAVIGAVFRAVGAECDDAQSLAEATRLAIESARREGAEAMREAAVAACLLVDDEYDALACAEAIRALPLPEVPR